MNLEFFQLPWGVELDNYKRLPQKKFRRLREKLGWTDSIVLISTRFWDSIYRIPTLIEAFTKIIERRKDVRLLLIGDGPLRSEVINRIKEKNIEEYIHIPGRIQEKELIIWYGSADLYVSSAISDGSSVSLLEAMACELPVIVNDGKGNNEWIINEYNGWLANCEDSNDLFNTLLKAVSSREQWKKMGSINRKRVIDNADWRNNLYTIISAYENAYNHHKKIS